LVGVFDALVGEAPNANGEVVSSEDCLSDSINNLFLEVGQAYKSQVEEDDDEEI